MFVIVMGVSGSGKTTIGKLLAARLKCEFADADDYHPPTNVEKMRAGIPLTDADRLPWLDALRQFIGEYLAADRHVVLACSALKAAYRERLGIGEEVRLVYLKGDYELIAQRLSARRGHYMNPRLLRSQFETLEEPSNAITIDTSSSPDETVALVEKALQV
jgi:gluconokinase